MKNVLSVLIGITLLVSFVSLSDGKEKKKAKTAEPARKQQSSGVWQDAKATPSTLVKAQYKLDGSIITIQFKNLSDSSTVRIRYQAKWQKEENGKWVDDASQEGVTIRLRKLEELQKDVLTHSKNIKGVSVTVEADEVS